MIPKFKTKLFIFPTLIFGVLFITFINTVPYLDGNIDFNKSHDFFEGGFLLLFKNWSSIHPPLKEIFNLLSFTLFGENAISYNLSALVLGALGTAFFYFLTRSVGNFSFAAVPHSFRF